MSVKLKLPQLSALQRRHSSLLWPFARQRPSYSRIAYYNAPTSLLTPLISSYATSLQTTLQNSPPPPQGPTHSAFWWCIGRAPLFGQRSTFRCIVIHIPPPPFPFPTSTSDSGSLTPAWQWWEWFSDSGHCLTPACAPSLRYWWWIWTGLLHERPINWQDCQDIELAQVIQVLILYSSSMTKFVQCSMLWSFLPWLADATWFLVRQDSWKS